jgi:lycopene beta-cyclase
VKYFDYIISGAGASGLSLLMRFIQNPAFSNKKILVVDQAPKDQNDRTWCFWEREPGFFEPIVYHQWQQVYFHSHDYSSLIDLSPYQYKMIRGIDFYNYSYTEASKKDNISFQYGKVSAMGNEGDRAFILIDEEKIYAEYIFNSIMFSKPKVSSDKFYLLQHFKGWVLETDAPAFDSTKATFMDFRVSQHHGTTFCYVLPVSANRALIEYTLFTKNLLKPEEYDDGLKNYISTFLNLNDYRVIEEEFGVIPMTNYKFSKGEGRIVHIGTVGGQTKPSSGYTFRFIQKHSDALIHSLLLNGHPFTKKDLVPARFNFYDTTFLNVLYNNKLPGEKIFTDMFSKNSAERIFKFLDNESNLEDELNILGSLPYMPFTKAALQEIFK